MSETEGDQYFSQHPLKCLSWRESNVTDCTSSAVPRAGAGRPKIHTASGTPPAVSAPKALEHLSTLRGSRGMWTSLGEVTDSNTGAPAAASRKDIPANTTKDQCDTLEAWCQLCTTELMASPDPPFPSQVSLSPGESKNVQFLQS